MSDPKLSVTLTGPAKIDGQHEPAGKTVTVSHTLALQLAASGVINPDAAKALSDAIADTPLSSDFEAAVSAEVEKRLVDLKAVAEELREELSAAKADVAKLTESLTAEVNARAELEKQLAAVATPPADGGPTTNTPKAGRKPAATKD